MMICPQCGKELKIPNAAEGHLQTYGNPVMTRSQCCGKGVTIRPVVTLEATPYKGDRKTDDWGNLLEPDETVTENVFVVIVNPPSRAAFVGPFPSRKNAQDWIIEKNVISITWLVETETPEEYLDSRFKSRFDD